MKQQTVFASLGALALGILAGRVSLEAPSFDSSPSTVASVPIAPEVQRSETLPSRRAPANPAIRVAGVQVQRPLERPSAFGGTSPFFGTDDCVRIALELDLERVQGAADKRVIELRTDASELTRFVDDRGTNLATKRTFGGPFDMQSRISEDGLGLLVTVLGNNAPERTAKTLEAEGRLAVLCAGQRTTETSDELGLVQGTHLQIGPFALKVGETGASEFDASRWAIEFITDDDLSPVIAWSLVTDAGEVVPLDVSMTWRMNQRTSVTLLAPRALERAKVRLERWTDAEVQNVPFSVITGLAPQ